MGSKICLPSVALGTFCIGVYPPIQKVPKSTEAGRFVNRFRGEENRDNPIRDFDLLCKLIQFFDGRYTEN